MSRAREIATTLGNTTKEGRGWRCRCPVHDGVSLNLADGEDGRLLAYCWGGCSPIDILVALRERGLGDRRHGGKGERQTETRRHDDRSDEARRQRERRIRFARNLIGECVPIFGTEAERYLRSRYLKPPRGIGFHPVCPHPGGFKMAAMIAPVRHVAHGVVAAHCTFLKDEKKAPIDRPKIIHGPCGGGAAHFGAPEPQRWLAVTEGLENALTVAQAGEMAAWAALSAAGIEALILPSAARLIVICADHDSHGRGERAARKAAARWLAEGRRVRIAMPTEIGADFNDFLCGKDAATIKDISHVAA